jgi:hypothetical protein
MRILTNEVFPGYLRPKKLENRKKKPVKTVKEPIKTSANKHQNREQSN